MRYRIKVETRGSGGAKNVLTKAEIAEAECIIVAADTQVPMDRFAGKPVIQCKVADGISKAEELLTKAANGHASIYEAGGKAADDEEAYGIRRSSDVCRSEFTSIRPEIKLRYDHSDGSDV